MLSNDLKTRVAVLYGGASVEHEVSLISAANVIKQLDPARYDVSPVGIDKHGHWFLGDEVFNLSLQHKRIPELDHMAKWFTPQWISSPISAEISRSSKPNTSSPSFLFDVIFPVVHGANSEDGRLQGLLELANVPYVGSGVLGSAINMDKDVTKRLVQQAGIRIAPYLTFRKKQWLTQPEVIVEAIEALQYPVFVKPSNTGSSVGVHKVKSPDQLMAALEDAFFYDHKIVVEKALNVMELEIAVLEALEPQINPIVSMVGEVRSNHEFYTYEAKYLDENGAQFFIPAELSADELKIAQSMAKETFNLLECEGMARVDLFLDLDTREIYFNEINTIPGFTSISMYPKLMIASGMNYAELLNHLIDLAIQRHQAKQLLNKNYNN